MTSQRASFLHILLAQLVAFAILFSPFFPVVALAEAPSATEAALPSWNDGPAKQAIVDFVKATTDESSPDFVPPEERIATFDQDGTLWVEHPIYSQVMYCLDPCSGSGQGQAGTGQCRAVQNGDVGRSRGDRKAIDT